MTWSTKFVASSKESAKAKVDEECAKEHGLPKSVGELIKAQIELLDEQYGTAVEVESNGHLGDAYSGSASFRVCAVKLC